MSENAHESSEKDEARKKAQQEARRVVAKLGGATAVARFFGIKDPSIHDWYKWGIPAPRKIVLMEQFPEVFELETDRAA